MNAVSRRKNFLVAFVTALAVIAVALILTLNYSTYHSKLASKLNQSASNAALDAYFPVIKIALENGNSTQTYWAYIATNTSQQERGYMNVSGLGDCHGVTPCIGMLFYFQSQQKWCFWMENTQIPLKQAWLNATGVVTYVYNATPLSTYDECQNGSMVLETSPTQPIAIGEKLIIQGTP